MVDFEQRVEAVEVAAAVQRQRGSFESLPFSSGDVHQEIDRMRRSSRRRMVVGIVLALLAALVIVALVILKIPSSLGTVPTGEMMPTLERGQVVYTQPAAQVHAGDVVLCKSASSGATVKRIIACPGEWVAVTDDGQTAVSDQRIKKGALVEGPGSDGVVVAAVEVPEHAYFAMGDAASISEAALVQADNFIADDQIQSRVVAKLWPPSGVGPRG